jgi:hypothetical protein
MPWGAQGQTDQGAITGTVTDTQGAVIQNATVTITNLDTQLQLTTKTNASGIYVFAPIKVGQYRVKASMPQFETTVRESVQVHVEERVAVNLTLQVGNISQTITVEAKTPQLQTQEASTGQVFTPQVIDDTPLDGRNYVYIAQLAAGISIPNGIQGAAGAAQMLNGSGDFTANGQRIWQNNFILDGVDNNSNLQDFLNGATYVMRPPPDALQEFKVQTSDYSAELGHSAGAVVNAAIKSGSNQFHGDLWEYFRNNGLDAQDFNLSGSPPFNAPYHQNQFGFTLGGPLLKNKLFFFLDDETTRIVATLPPQPYNTVPTAKIKTGDFTEMLNPDLTTGLGQIYLYQVGGNTLATPSGPEIGPPNYLTCNGVVNVICSNQLDAVAQKILNLFPAPNAGVAGQVFNNYTIPALKTTDDPLHLDARLDWNLSSRDQAFVRYSHSNRPQYFPPPFGPILDGGGFGTSGTDGNLSHNIVLSETHYFNSKLVNEFRFGYNYIKAYYLQQNANSDLAAQLGLGGIPFYAENGGLPDLTWCFGAYCTGVGSPGYMPSDERENVFQILDNLTKVWGKHALKFGLSFQHTRFSGLQPPNSLGSEYFWGSFTSDPTNVTAYTGSGFADFLLDLMYQSGITAFSHFIDERWYDAAFVQDDWKVNKRLTLQLGLRYDYPEPNAERDGLQANFIGNYANMSAGTGTFLIPNQAKNFLIPPSLQQAFATDHVQVQYTSNRYVVNPDKKDFAPRIGIAYQLNDKTVIRTGFGIFYGGLENLGLGPNLGSNAPFNPSASFIPTNGGGCLNVLGVVNCATDGQTLETGFSAALSAPGGLNAFASLPTVFAAQQNAQTPYSMAYNLTVERAINQKTSFKIGYVGNVDRHLQMSYNANVYAGAIPIDVINSQAYLPFPDLGTIEPIVNQGISSYNSLQATIQHQYSHGLSFLGNYTWGHCMDDAFGTIGQWRYGGYRNPNLLGFGYDYGACVQDVRQRVTFNGQYQLPVGRGKKYLNRGGVWDQVLGGWRGSLLFVAQTGLPVFINSSNQGESYPYKISDPFKPGGTPDPNTQVGFVCATATRTLQSWYNPCAFANPPVVVSDSAVIAPGANEVHASQAGLLPFGPRGRVSVPGPGYNKTDMSIFKSFPIPFHESKLEFRTDFFNLFNHPSFGIPNNGLTGSTASAITNTLFSGETPDARVIQFALKYTF